MLSSSNSVFILVPATDLTSLGALTGSVQRLIKGLSFGWQGFTLPLRARLRTLCFLFDCCCYPFTDRTSAPGFINNQNILATNIDHQHRKGTDDIQGWYLEAHLFVTKILTSTSTHGAELLTIWPICLSVKNLAETNNTLPGT